MENATSGITAETTSGATSEGQVLVVTSKIKAIGKAAGMNTAGDVPAALTAIVEREFAKAINNAKNDGRKTVTARDFIEAA